MTAYTGKTDNRGTMREREITVSEILAEQGIAARVQIGGRSRVFYANIDKVREIVQRMYRQPAPLIWRALGVEA